MSSSPVDQVSQPLHIFMLVIFLCGCGVQQHSPQVETGEIWPGTAWQKATPEEMKMDAELLYRARDYALTGGGSGYIIRSGRLVLSWGDPAERYDLKSTTKSMAGATALGLAIKDDHVSLNDRAQKFHPYWGVPPAENTSTGWLNQITLLHLATHTAGFDKNGGYTPLLFEPGTRWFYSDGGPNWLAECLTLAYGEDLNDVLFRRIFTQIGIQPADLTWRENAYRPRTINGLPRREFGSGLHANVDAMARLGYLYLRIGRWQDQQILPAAFVEQAGRPVPAMNNTPVHDPIQFGEDSILGDVSGHYGLLWWNNADGTLPVVPEDAYWSWGLYESLIVVIPSLDLVIARAGDSWHREPGMTHYAILGPFLNTVAASVQRGHTVGINQDADAPYPPSSVIDHVVWAPVETILRKAEGSDNWPLTWADDGHLYTAYGDGWGFEPKVLEKLSLGLARVEGYPPNILGQNIRSETAEQKGQGAEGKKASGMLMVDGVLYMWVRNAGNARLTWSEDRGRTWIWADWTFTTSFGAPTFLNFGRNYAGARDSFVYVYSHDANSAYEPADRMILARVSRDSLTDRSAYTFFENIEEDNLAHWTRDINERGVVFSHPGSCYRSGISYNTGLKRYLWSQTIPGGDTRFEGGFGIYEAPEPWGPWRTVFFTRFWDVGPGETMSFPTKWMSEDGNTAHLVFSGDDHFSVRQATFVPVSPSN